METVTLLRELWRRRILVGLVALVAIFVGLVLGYRFTLPPESRKYEVGIASARILVDTPHSQVVEVAPKGSETLGVRANLLSNLMTEGEVRAAIARRAGLRPKQLFAVAESSIEAQIPLPDVEPASQPHILTTRLVTNTGGEPLPIIEIEAQAPDAGRAGQLASAAVTGLGAYLDSKAAVDAVPDARRLRVTGLGSPQVREEVRGPRSLIALGASILIFLVGCAAILIVSALAQGWRTASAREELADDGYDSEPFEVPLDQDLDSLWESRPAASSPSTQVLTPLRQRGYDAPESAEDNGSSPNDQAGLKSA